MTVHFRSLDERYSKATGATPLLPLRAHERRYVADTTCTLAAFERRSPWRGTAVLALQLLVSAAVVAFDRLVHWVLVVVTTHAVADPRDPSVPLNVDELAAALVDSGLRPPEGPWPPPPRSAADPTVCLPSPRASVHPNVTRGSRRPCTTVCSPNGVLVGSAVLSRGCGQPILTKSREFRRLVYFGHETNTQTARR